MKNKEIEELVKRISAFTGEINLNNLDYIRTALNLVFYKGKNEAFKEKDRFYKGFVEYWEKTRLTDKP